MPITYTPLTNFAAKDQMPAGDPGKIIRGVDFTAEFDEIARLFQGAMSLAGANPSLTVDTLTVNLSATLPTPPDNTNKALGVNIQYLEATLGGASIDVTTGAPDAAKIIKTDANGLLDNSFMPGVATTTGVTDAGKVVKTDAAGVLDNSFIPQVWLKTNHIVTFAGAAGATGLPVVTNTSGLIDQSLLPTNSMIVHGAVDVTAPTTLTPAWGDVYFAQTAGTVDPSWPGIGGMTVSIGDQITFGSDGNWHIMPNLADLGGYLPLAGGTMVNYIVAHAAPVADMQLANKKYVDDIRGAAISASRGTPDANTLVQTGANGRLDISMMPTSALRAKGGLDPAVTPPTSPMEGDMYFLSKDGTFNAGYGAPLSTTTGHSGDVFLYGAGGWHHVPSSADLKPFVLKIGDTMTSDLKYASNPADANSYTNKRYVDAQVATRLTQAQVDARVPIVGNPLYAAIADKYPGDPAINTLINAQSYTKAQADAKYATKTGYVAKAGDTMTGALNIVPAAGTATTTALNVTGKIVASGDIWALSDDRLKDDKESIIDAAESIAGLDTFSYSWSEEAVEAGLADPNDERRMLGVSAQEVARVFPECVSEGDHGYLTVSYDKLAVVALRGIQELLGRVEYLEAQLHDD